MHNYIRYRLALNPQNVRTWGSYYPSIGEENPLISGPNLQNANIFKFWDNISKAHENLPIFRLGNNQKIIRPYTTSGITGYGYPLNLELYPLTLNYSNKNNLGYGIGHFLAHEMTKHPVGSYTLDDYLEDHPNLKFDSRDDPIINKQIDKESDRNKTYFQLLPKLWNKTLNENPDNILEHFGKGNSESELEELLKDAVLTYAKKGYKLGLNPANWYQDSVWHYTPQTAENSPNITLYNKGNMNEMAPSFNILNNLVHMHQGIPGIFRRPDFYRTLHEGGPFIGVSGSYQYGPDDNTTNYPRYNFTPEVFGRTLGHILAEHINTLKRQGKKKLPYLHDVLEDYLSNDKEAQNIINDFHKKYDIPHIIYDTPAELRRVILPIAHDNVLRPYYQELDTNTPFTSEDLHKLMSTPKEGDTALEHILKEDYNNLGGLHA